MLGRLAGEIHRDREQRHQHRGDQSHPDHFRRPADQPPHEEQRGSERSKQGRVIEHQVQVQWAEIHSALPAGGPRNRWSRERSGLPGREEGLAGRQILTGGVEHRVVGGPFAPEHLVRVTAHPAVQSKETRGRGRAPEHLRAPEPLPLPEQGFPGPRRSVRLGERGGLGLVHVELPQDVEHGSGPAPKLGDPPTEPHQEETPVVKELGRLPLDGVARELEDPADHEEGDRGHQQGMHEERRHEQGNRECDQRNAERVAEPIDGMLMAL